MKKVLFLTLFIVTHVGFFFLQIQKQMQFIKESFTRQKQEQLIVQLKQKKQAKLNDLYALQDRQEVQNYAAKELKLKPLRIGQLRRADHDSK